MYPSRIESHPTRSVFVALMVMLITGIGCQKDSPPTPATKAMPRTVLVIHGGAGVVSDDDMKRFGLQRNDFEKALETSLKVGFDALKQNKSSVEAVEAAIRVMENSRLFNAGSGAAFNSDGRVELDAAIMDGSMQGAGEGKKDPRKRAGAVACVTHVKNPISAARAVLEMPDSEHVMLVGDGAEAFVLNDVNRAKYQIDRVSNIDFWTDRRLTQIREKHSKTQKHGTVGAVALDHKNNLAAGTSTGGLTGKMPGRVGDSPILGAGTYADSRACGVSCTGTGEVFIRHAVAHDVVARMLYGKQSVGDAVRDTIAELPDEPDGVGGLIALDAAGRHVFGISKKTVGMYRGFITEDGKIVVSVMASEN